MTLELTLTGPVPKPVTVVCGRKVVRIQMLETWEATMKAHHHHPAIVSTTILHFMPFRLSSTLLPVVSGGHARTHVVRGEGLPC